MSGLEYAKLRKSVMLALLATGAKYPCTVDGETSEERLSDQARRVALLIAEESFGEERDGWWVEHKEDVAAALEMDAKDAGQAIAKLTRLALLLVEPRDNGWWFQLLPARIALAERAMKSTRALARIRARAQQLMLIARQHHGTTAPAVLAVLDETDAETGLHEPAPDEAKARPRVPTLHAARLVGKLPTGAENGGESPHSQWGDSPPETRSLGRVPSDRLYGRERLRVDSQIGSKSQIVESRSDGSGGESGAARRVQFGDSEKAWLADMILPLVEEEGRTLGDPEKAKISRFKWLQRIRDNAPDLAMAHGEMEEAKRKGEKFQKPLGVWFKTARNIARGMGRSLKSILCL